MGIKILPPTGLTQTVIEGKNVALDWAETAGAKGYYLQYSKSEQFADVTVRTTSLSIVNISNLTDGVYYWRVQAADGSGNLSEWATGSSFMIDVTAPTVPTELTRTIVENKNVAFDWADAIDATSGVKNYIFQYSTNALFTGATERAVSVSNASVSNLAAGTYYWRVKTIDKSGNASGWTTGSNFVIGAAALPKPAGLTQTVIEGKNVALDWAETAGAKGYYLQYSKSEQFADVTVRTTSLSNVNISNLTDGVYYWRLQATDGAGNFSEWATGSSFMIDVTAPTVPSELTRTIVENKNVAFDWADATDATSGVKNYIFQYSTNALFTGATERAVSVSNAAVSNLAADTYYWRVKTIDKSGNASGWTTGSNFVIGAAALPKPTGLTQTVIEGKNVALDWVETAGAKGYYLQYSKSEQFADVTVRTTSLSNVNVSNLTDGVYYWRLQATDGAGNFSEWATGSSFMIDVTAPTTPAELTRTIVESKNVAFDWADATDATSGVKNYIFQYSTNALFTGATERAVSVSNAAVSNLAAGTYYWRVKTIDKSGNASEWTNGESFVKDISGNSNGATLLSDPSVTGSVGLNEPYDYYRLVMDKNGILTLNLTELTGDANLMLMDAKGKLLKISANTGNTSEIIANTLLTSGTYYVSVALAKGTSSAAYALSHAETYFPDDKAENTWQAAKDIATLDNWVGFGDPADYYKLAMTNAGTLTLGLTGLSGNADLSLLNATGALLRSNPKTGTASEGISDIALLAGTYYVKVAAAAGVNNAGYTLIHEEKYCPTDTAANTWQTAKDIANLDNWVGFGDPADYYKLNMTNAGTLTLGLTGLSGNADLSLLNAAGALLRSNPKTGTASEGISDIALLAGTYYVKVAAAAGASSANYTLIHEEKYCPTDTAANYWQTAKDIAALDNWVGFGDPADYYKLTMTNAGTLTLGLTGLSGNADLSLLNAAGSLLRSNPKTGTASEGISDIALLAGTYYVKVAAVAGVNSAGYTLIHEEKYFPDDKAGNSFTQAFNVTTSGPVNEWLGFGDRDDYYKFDLKIGTSATLNLEGINSNVDLFLYDSKFRQLEMSRNTGNSAESITKLLAAGTYYVKATLAGKDNTNYTLTFNIDPMTFKSGGLQLFSASSPLTGSSDASPASNDPLKKSPGMLAS